MLKTWLLRAIWQADRAQQARSFHFRHAVAHAAIAPRSTNFSQWYLDIIASADLAETSPVKVQTVLLLCVGVSFSQNVMMRVGLSHFEAKCVRVMGQYSSIS